MKRFSVAEDREFEIAGEVFQFVYPYWEDIAKVFDENQSEEEQTVHSTIKDLIDKIALFIDPVNDGVARWKALSTRKTNPVPHAHYAELYRWLLEVTSDPHPTEQSGLSENGQQNEEATSPVASSSRGGTRKS